ncbi:hypothetical protein [Streptomyces hyaluromycini]|uniref:hypothetical protein n=1 Tax=Streptomyces hyaluromycini TaxID=1377993 RepID=UPI00142D4C46|nr:hypothetical protein [Streptomyces hyaluromycini]
MRFAPMAAASGIALGALLGGFTTSSDAHAPGTVQQRTVASSTETVLFGTTDNNGNG